MTTPEPASAELLQHFRHGDDAAATELHQRYVVRLVALARARLGRGFAARVDAEDIVQSAYRSFFLRARAGEFELQRSGDLWRLLARITLRKLYRQTERHTADRRSIRRETMEFVDGESSVAAESREPTPAEVAALADELAHAMRGLSDFERRVLELRLQENTMDEIAAELGRSERTIRRTLAAIRQALAQEQLAMPTAHNLLGNIDRVVERFEAQARGGRAPAIERMVLEVADQLTPDERRALLIELIAIDLEYRWQSPHRRGPLVELYVKRLGEWASLDDVPLELVAEEYRARHRFGDRPAHAEYAARFPRHGQSLQDELRCIDAELASEYPQTEINISPDKTTDIPGPQVGLSDPAAPLDYRDYAIRRLIATGGMSRVYTAVQKSLRKPVAIKVLNKQLARNVRSVQRFLREARIAAALDLPGMVNALGLGRFPDGGYFMVLRLIDGADLTRLPGGIPLPQNRALDLTRRVVERVLTLHERGWLHCDLKPSNVLIDSRGEPWLTDFAMAQPWRAHEKAFVEDDRFALGGTPAFMAPEQFVGDPELVSPATDIYAIGGILNYLLTAKSPRELGGTLIDNVVARRCLVEQPAQRYVSCHELLAALTDEPMTNAFAAR